jgi:hypothetical protein
MTVNVEICLIPVQALADVISHPAEGEHITAAIKRESIREIQTVTSDHFDVDGFQAGIVSLKGMLLARDGHLLDDIAGLLQKSQKGRH